MSTKDNQKILRKLENGDAHLEVDRYQAHRFCQECPISELKQATGRAFLPQRLMIYMLNAIVVCALIGAAVLAIWHFGIVSPVVIALAVFFWWGHHRSQEPAGPLYLAVLAVAMIGPFAIVADPHSITLPFALFGFAICLSELCAMAAESFVGRIVSRNPGAARSFGPWVCVVSHQK